MFVSNLKPVLITNLRPAYLVCLLALSLLLFSFASHAKELISSDETTVSLDSTFSTGLAVRMSNRDTDQIADPNFGGTDQTKMNDDNGNLNYDQGDIVSANAKVTHELFVDSGDIRLFARGFYFYDEAVVGGNTKRTPLPDRAKTVSGRNVQLLDLYMDTDFEIAGRPATLRIGNQVMNWGESLFIRNGLNSINPVDVSKIRIAGAEVRDALQPLPAFNIKMDINDEWSAEGFYLADFRNTEIEPSGTFFSTNDYVSPGGSVVHLTAFAGTDTNFDDCNLSPSLDLFRNLPLASAVATTTSGIPVNDPRFNAAVVAAVTGWSLAGICSNITRSPDREPDNQNQFGFALRGFLPQLNYAELGVYFANIHSRLPLISAVTGTQDSITFSGSDPYVLSQGQPVLNPRSTGVLTGSYAGSTRYFREFPENIKMFGMSINSNFGSTGWSLQGELVYRIDQPLQLDDDQILTYGLSPLERLRTGSGAPTSFIFVPGTFSSNNNISTTPADFGQTITGWRRKNVIQAQLAAVKSFGPSTFGDSSVFLIEFGTTQVMSLEDKNTLRYEGVGNTGADKSSWGYRLIAQTTRNNALGAISLTPRIALSHDVEGTAPAPVQNFKEGRKIITLSVNGSYLDKWRGSLSYTNSFGNNHNENDRDFLSFSISRSF